MKQLTVLIACLIAYTLSFSQPSTESTSDSTLVSNEVLIQMAKDIQTYKAKVESCELINDTMEAIINDLKFNMQNYESIILFKNSIITTYELEVDSYETLVEQLKIQNDAQKKALRRKTIGLWTGISGSVALTIPLIVLAISSN